MKRLEFRKWLFLALCLLACLLLTGCYKENDPWPQADLGGIQFTAAPTATAVSATEPPATAAPATVQPAATQEPLPDDAVDVSPNLNG